MLRHSYQNAFRIQALHVLLCIAWNVVGLLQMQYGVQPIGPTASIYVILVAPLLVAALAMSLHKNYEIIYMLLAAIAFLFAAAAIHGGLTKDSSLWPSEFWRLAGILVNAVGVLGFVMALTTFIRRKREKLLS